MQIDSKYWLYALLCVLFICCAYLLFEFISLRDSSSTTIYNLELNLQNQTNRANYLQSSYISSLKEISTLKVNLQNISSQLQTQKTQNQQVLAQLNLAKQNITYLEDLLDQSTKKAQSMREEFISLQESISSSMSWFKQNSKLDSTYSWSVDIFLKRIHSDCIYNQTLNLACINYLNERTVLYLQYLNDLDIGEVDHLQSINQTIKRRGGDCEDFALFFKAILQTLKTNENLYVKTWEPSEYGQYAVWPQTKDPEYLVFYPKAQQKIISNLKNTYPVVICYTVNSMSGHCRIALSETKITVDSIQNLDGAPVFEPQNGQYSGIIGTDYQICSKKISDCKYFAGAITVVITDDDILNFNDSKWDSYSNHHKKVNEILQTLN